MRVLARGPEKRRRAEEHTHPPDNETREFEVARTAGGFASAKSDCYDT